MPTAWRLDWRQVRRWGIDEQDIPADAVVSFRSPSFFEEHRKETIAAAALFLLQTGLIAWLLMERRRRHLAELAVQKHRHELAHASRLAVAGELTGSIAHEINQPLGAILSNADAAELILESGARSDRDRREDLRAILADIRRDDLRASSVIQRLRSLLAKQEVEHQRFDLNDAAIDAADVLRAEARRRRVDFEVRPAADPALMIGDPVQIQQVLIILVLNAMDAIVDLPDDRCMVIMSLERRSDCHALAVRDCGTGIAPEHLPRVFDSFFSTKRKGMGLGLSIARSLVEAHGGRIWAENGPVQGAIFHVELPVARVASAGPEVPS
jgi:signal transduction histidine kinase